MSKCVARNDPLVIGIASPLATIPASVALHGHNIVIAYILELLSLKAERTKKAARRRLQLARKP